LVNDIPVPSVNREDGYRGLVRNHIHGFRARR
jgi:hypothetical protein